MKLVLGAAGFILEISTIVVGWRSSEILDNDFGAGGAEVFVLVSICGHLAPMLDCLLLRLVAAVHCVV